MGVGDRAGADRVRLEEPDKLKKGSQAIAEVLPDADLRVLEGQTHNVNMKALAPVLADFLAIPSARAVAHR